MLSANYRDRSMAGTITRQKRRTQHSKIKQNTNRQTERKKAARAFVLTVFAITAENDFSLQPLYDPAVVSGPRKWILVVGFVFRAPLGYPRNVACCFDELALTSNTAL